MCGSELSGTPGAERDGPLQEVGWVQDALAADGDRVRHLPTTITKQSLARRRQQCRAVFGGGGGTTWKQMTDMLRIA